MTLLTLIILSYGELTPETIGVANQSGEVKIPQDNISNPNLFLIVIKFLGIANFLFAFYIKIP